MQATKRVISILLTFAMVFTTIFANVEVVRATEENSGSAFHKPEQDGLYFLSYNAYKEAEDGPVLSKATGLYDWAGIDLPDEFSTSFVLKQGDSYSLVPVNEISISYNSEILDDLEGTPVFNPIENKSEYYEILENLGDDEWTIRSINGCDELSINSAIPITYFSFKKTGTYEFKYTSGGTPYSQYIRITHCAWDFYLTNEITNNPVRELNWASYKAGDKIYIKQDDGNVNLGKLAEGVVSTESPVAVYVWDENVHDDVKQPLSDYIVYDSSDHTITLKEDKRNSFFTIRLYMYYTNDLGELEQHQINLFVFAASIWYNWYDNNHGTVSYKKQGDTGYTLLNNGEENSIWGAEGQTIEFLLEEKPSYPENYNWENGDSEDFGWRYGSTPVVKKHNGDEEVKLTIDDNSDSDAGTWHTSYTFHEGDSIEFYWSEFDAFGYEAKDQYQICLNNVDSNDGSYTITDTEQKIQSQYGNKYNYSAGTKNVSITVTPKPDREVRRINIGDIEYYPEKYMPNGEDVPVNVQVMNSENGFTYDGETGAWTYTFPEDYDFHDYWYDENGVKQPAMEHDHSTDQDYHRYGEKRINIEFAMVSQFSVSPLTNEAGIDVANSSITLIDSNGNTSEKVINGIEFPLYKLYDANGDQIYDRINVKLKLHDDYTISDDLDFIYHYEGGQEGTDLNRNAVAQALTSDDGYTFTYENKRAPEEPTEIRLQLKINKVFSKNVTLDFYVQESQKDEYGVDEKDENGQIIYDSIYKRNGEDGIWMIDGITFNDNGIPYTWNLGEDSDNPDGLTLTKYGKDSGNNVFRFREAFGEKVTGVFIHESSNLSTDPLDTAYWTAVASKSDEDGEYYEVEFPVTEETAENYDILIQTAASDDLTIWWSYDDKYERDEHGEIVKDEHGQDKLSDRYIDPAMGSLEIVSVEREGRVLRDDEYWSDISATGGYVQLKRGDRVTINLVPKYGYELVSSSFNGNELVAQEGVNTFVVEMYTNLHASGIFKEAIDKIDVSAAEAVTSATISDGDNAAANGGDLKLTVADNASYSKNVAAAVSGANGVAEVTSVDVTLENEVSKGDGTYWTNTVTEFENPVTLSLKLNDIPLVDGESLSVVREHNGTLEELRATYDASSKKLSFATNKFSTYTIVKKHNHAMVKTAAVAPTEESEGNSEYYTCSICGKYFSDAAGTTEIAANSWILPKRNHTHVLTKTEAVAATCTTEGNSEYYTCSGCGKYFSDAAGTTEIAVNSWILPKTGHSLTKTVAVAATCTEAGNIEYYKCTDCDGYFSDAEGTNAISDKTSVVVAANGHIAAAAVNENVVDAKVGVEGSYESVVYCSVCHAEISRTKQTIPALTTPSTTEEGKTISDSKTKADYVVLTDTEGSCTVAYSGTKNSNAKKVTIPATVEVGGVTYKVTEIAEGAFKNNKKLTSVTISKSVTTIGADAFAGCTKLKSVVIPKNVTNIGKNAFGGCKKLTKITITSTKLTKKNVNKNAFKGISSKATIIVPKKKVAAYKNLFRSKGLSKKVNIKAGK